MRPEITRLIPRKSKKDRNIRVEFICPTCNKPHVMRLTAFDKITDGRYPCPNNKKASFKAWIEKQVGSLTTEQKSVINQMLLEGKSQNTIIKKFKLPHPAVLHAIMHPTCKEVPNQASNKVVKAPEAIAPASVPPRSVANTPNATVNKQVIEANPKPKVPARPEPKRPDFPMPQSSKFNALPFAQRWAADQAWAAYYKQMDNCEEEQRRRGN